MRLKDTEVAPVETPEPAKVDRLTVDDKRKTVYRNVTTNIMVRAFSEQEGRMVNCDIAHLERKSLLTWLSEDNDRTVRTVLVMLGHPLS